MARGDRWRTYVKGLCRETVAVMRHLGKLVHERISKRVGG